MNIDFEALIADPSDLLEYAKNSYLSNKITLELYADIILMRYVELQVTKETYDHIDYSLEIINQNSRLLPYKPELIAILVKATKLRRLDDII